MAEEKRLSEAEIDAILSTVSFLSAIVLRSIAAGAFPKEQRDAWVARIKAAQEAVPEID